MKRRALSVRPVTEVGTARTMGRTPTKSAGAGAAKSAADILKEMACPSGDLPERLQPAAAPPGGDRHKLMAWKKAVEQGKVRPVRYCSHLYSLPSPLLSSPSSLLSFLSSLSSRSSRSTPSLSSPLSSVSSLTPPSFLSSLLPPIHLLRILPLLSLLPLLPLLLLLHLSALFFPLFSLFPPLQKLHHRIPLHSINEVSKCVSMTWRAICARPSYEEQIERDRDAYVARRRQEMRQAGR